MATIGQNTSRTKQINQSLVLKTLMKYQPISRQEIAEKTKLTPATITNITSQLLKDEYISEIGNVGNSKKGAGRRSVALGLNGDVIHVIGIHISLTETHIGLVNLNGEIKKEQISELPGSLNKKLFLDYLKKEIETFMEQTPESIIQSIGIGAPGLVDFKQGKIVNADHLGLKDVDLSREIEKIFNKTVLLDNNVRAMTLAEKVFGDGRFHSDFMTIFLGDGIGSGMVLNDLVYRGGSTGAGEFGHMTYMPGGIKCWCGNQGCIERYASEAEILYHLNLSFEELKRMVENQETAAIEQLEHAGEQIGSVLTSVINMLHVPKVIMSGRLASDEYPLTKMVDKTLHERSFLARQQHVMVEPSQLGEKIGLMGAASLALIYDVLAQE